MAERAHITSVDALNRFRANLITYHDVASSTLDEVGEEVKRMRMWLQNDQRRYWERKHKTLLKELERLRQELFSSRLSNINRAASEDEVKMKKVRRSVWETEERIKIVAGWARNFDSRVDTRYKRLESMQFVLSHDLPKAINFLLEAIKALESYTRMAAPSAPASGPGDSEDAGAAAGEAEGSSTS